MALSSVLNRSDYFPPPVANPGTRRAVYEGSGGCGNGICQWPTLHMSLLYTDGSLARYLSQYCPLTGCGFQSLSQPSPPGTS